jgi:hypothetical protein
MARGIEAGAANPEYARLQAELAGLQAGQAAGGSRTQAEIEADALRLYPRKDQSLRMRGIGNKSKISKYNKEQEAKREAFIRSAGDPGQDRASRIAQIEAQMQDMSPTLEGTPGLFDLLEEQSTRAGALQREQLGLQRESDVAALQKFAPQVVEAYRAADPYSTGLAEQATDRAQLQDASAAEQQLESLGMSLSDAQLQRGGAGANQLKELGMNLANAQLQGANVGEQQIQDLGLNLANAQLQGAGAAEQQLQAMGMDLSNANLQAASAAEQQLQAMGMSLSDLSPTEQEALISQRGMEFAASTGELTTLEKRRAQQSARQASTSRGRGMDQSALYAEMQARAAEEMNKKEREISMGAQLLGQQAGLRNARLAQGASTLTGSEALAAQRRSEQLQQKQVGSNVLLQGEGLAAQRRAEQLQRQQSGSGLLLSSEALSAQRRAEQLQRQQSGSNMLLSGEGLDAQLRAEQLQRQQAGSNLLLGSAGLATQRRGEYGQNLQQAFGMNRGLAGDVGMTILGRPSQSIGLGSQVLGQAQQGAAGPMGPQLFDPNVGLNMAMQQRGQDITFQGMQAQANAASSAGIMGAAGSIAGAAMMCWVAREVYGIESGKWMQFREWMLNDSPSWFLKLYLKYGERFAKFISNKPRIKSIIRNWMNTKIK